MSMWYIPSNISVLSLQRNSSTIWFLLYNLNTAIMRHRNFIPSCLNACRLLNFFHLLQIMLKMYIPHLLKKAAVHAENKSLLAQVMFYTVSH